MRRKSYSHWSYLATREEDGTVTAEVDFDHRSVQGIRNFVTANQQLIADLANTRGEVTVEVTFREPLDINTYRDRVQKAGVSHFDYIQVWPDTPNVSTMGLVASPIQMIIISDSADSLPQKALDEAMSSNRQDLGEFTIKGVVAFSGKIDPVKLPALAADPQVFLVDVSTNIVRKDLVEAGMTGATTARIRNPISIYAAMSKLGLENFSK
jgi:hypothetical protein